MTRLAEWLEALVRWFVVLTMVCIVLSMAAQVVDRYAVKSQFDAFEQIARIALVWGTFVGVALGVRTRTNLRIDLINLVLPPALVRVKDVVFDGAVLAISIVLHVKSWQLIDVLGAQQILGTPFTYAVNAAAVLVGTGLIIVFILLRLLGQAGHILPDEGTPAA